jgi:pSer/pThr/pTyr-binding forkhead associated (FHA) protein
MLERLPDGGWEVRDLGSTNGTWINAEAAPLTGARRLVDGDRIRLGAWTMIELRAPRP